jgi:hypothetical protein
MFNDKMLSFKLYLWHIDKCKIVNVIVKRKPTMVINSFFVIVQSLHLFKDIYNSNIIFTTTKKIEIVNKTKMGTYHP